MRKVTQIATDDCLAACISSLLDLPLAVVPVFRRTKDGNGQLRATQKWLAKLGYTLLQIPITGKRSPWKKMSVPTPCIVLVKATADYDHACVGRIDSNGISVLHDPARSDMQTGSYETVAVMFLTPSIPPGVALENLRLLKE